MKKIIILSALMLFFFAVVGASSQESLPTTTQGQIQPRELKSKASTRNNIKANDSNNNSQSLIIPIEEVNKDHATPNNSQLGVVQDNPITRYTCWLMVFTGLLVVCNVFSWLYTKKAADAAKKAANAAELSARAVISIELPIIRAKPAELVATNKSFKDGDRFLGGSITDSLPTKFSIVHFECCKNYGRSPAFPEMISVGWMVDATLPDQPQYLKSFVFNPASVIKPDPEDEFSLHDVHFGIDLTDDELEGIKEGRAWLWFYGCLCYRDFMNESREYRFCWRYANQTPEQTTSHYHFSSNGNPPKAYTKNL